MEWRLILLDRKTKKRKKMSHGSEMWRNRKRSWGEADRMPRHATARHGTARHGQCETGGYHSGVQRIQVLRDVTLSTRRFELSRRLRPIEYTNFISISFTFQVTAALTTNPLGSVIQFGSVSSPLCVWKLERVCSQTQLCQLRCFNDYH